MDEDRGQFFEVADPFAEGARRLCWNGRIDNELMAQVRRISGSVPAPFPKSPRQLYQIWIHNSGISKGSEYSPQKKLSVPPSIRHMAQWSDWNRPTTWPLAAHTFAGHVLDLYYADLRVLPSTSKVEMNRVDETLYSGRWRMWCSLADEVGFFGMDMNEGFPPYLIVFGLESSATAMQDEMIKPVAAHTDFYKTWFADLGSATASWRK